MPIVQISLNVDLGGQERQGLLLSVARLASEVLDKPLHDVMVSLNVADFVMGCDTEPAAFIDFRCLSGLQVDSTMPSLCEGMCDVLQQYVPIDPNRVYIHFLETYPEYAWRFRDGVAVCPKSALTVR